MVCCLSHRTVSDIYWLQQMNFKNTISYCLLLKNHLQSHIKPLQNKRKTSLSERKAKSNLLQDQKNNHLSIGLPMEKKLKGAEYKAEPQSLTPTFLASFHSPFPPVHRPVPDSRTWEHKTENKFIWVCDGGVREQCSGVCPLLPTCQL